MFNVSLCFCDCDNMYMLYNIFCFVFLDCAMFHNQPHDNAIASIAVSCGILALGIPWDETLNKFLDTAAGQDFMIKSSYVVPLNLGGLLYVPGGYHVSITSFEEVDKKADPGLNFCCHLVLKGACNNDVNLTSATTHAIKVSNAKVIDGKALGSQMWTDRKEYFVSSFEP